MGWSVMRIGAGCAMVVERESGGRGRGREDEKLDETRKWEEGFW
jgi:hypothetical protein